LKLGLAQEKWKRYKNIKKQSNQCLIAF